METTTNTPRKPATQRQDVYGIITDQIIEQLNNGVVPWRVPWTEPGVPTNLCSKKPYRGINVMLLASLGYERNVFLTQKQAERNGASIKDGENGTAIVFWDFWEQPLSEAEKAEGVDIKKIATLKQYDVFNIAQCDGIQAEYVPPVWKHQDPLDTAELFATNMPNAPRLQFKEATAYYDPRKDYVNMPKAKSFEDPESYYALLFHQLVHSTGHVSRLNRKDYIEQMELGYVAYTMEELVAEIASSYILSHLGLQVTFEHSTEYLLGWIAKLKADSRLIFQAAHQAQKAADYILHKEGEGQDKVSSDELP